MAEGTRYTGGLLASNSHLHYALQRQKTNPIYVVHWKFLGKKISSIYAVHWKTMTLGCTYIESHSYSRRLPGH